MESSCILSKFYIKPQHIHIGKRIFPSCILSKFYIKPQHRFNHRRARSVVSYRNSTSNHNTNPLGQQGGAVVSYRNSTSNHNSRFCPVVPTWLYLIEILHQTTTITILRFLWISLYLIEILHQTTTSGCVQIPEPWLYLIEILHQTTTSGLILIDKVLLTGCLPL